MCNVVKMSENLDEIFMKIVHSPYEKHRLSPTVSSVINAICDHWTLTKFLKLLMWIEET